MHTRFRRRFLAIILGLLFPLGTSARAATVSAVFNAAGDVPVTAGAYTATGDTVNFTLNFTPPTGTQLTVVKNTGLGFITGAFDNLAQGQVVALSYGGASYNFVANYFGGSGNDLVLQWAATRPVAWGYNFNGQLGTGGTTASDIPVAVNTTGVLAGKTLIALTGGHSFSLALCSDGTVAAWGANNFGQLGNGTTTESTVPVAVDRAGALAGRTVIAVAAGNSHCLALCSDGTLAAWGDNSSGQLGNNSTAQSNVPVAVDQTGALVGKSVVAVAAGVAHSFALAADGTLAAWGSNTNGQLGDGTTTRSTVPVSLANAGVLSGRQAIAIAAGDSHSLALCSDGKLAAWGSNVSGQLGNGTTAQSTVPVAVDQTGVLAGRLVTGIAVGSYHSLALGADGKLASWGNNNYGQLGNGGTFQSSVPVAVTTTGVLAGKTVATFAAGGSVSLALAADRTPVAWGANSYGQLGGGSTTQSNVPVAVSKAILASNESFAAATSSRGGSHGLGIVAQPFLPRIALETAGGAILASAAANVEFGSSAVGSGVSQTLTIRNNGTVPLAVGGVTIDGANASEFVLTTPPQAGVAAGGSTTLVVTFTPGAEFNRSAVLRLASNDPDTAVFNVALAGVGRGVLAATYTTGAEVPMTTAAFTATGSTVNLALNHTPATGTNLTVVRNTGLDFIKGNFDNLAQGQVVTLNHGGVDYPFVANYYGGSGNDLVLQWATTRLVAWGYNYSGQLGDGSTTPGAVPTPVSTAGVLAGKRIMALASGESHSLALCADGTLAAWGANIYGQLGNGTSSGSYVPAAVDQTGVLAGRTIIAIAAGDTHSLALCADGTLAAWGYNGNGQLGNGSASQSTVPVAVNMAGVLAGRTVVAVAAGQSHSLALCADGTVAAWGYNSTGQLGNGSTTSSNMPVAVSTIGVLAGRTVVAVAAGGLHNLALCADGTLVAWGNNNSGQLGNGSTTQSNVPVAVTVTGVLNGKAISAVAAGESHSLALCTDGTLAAWGYNGYGRLGNGNTTSSSVPTLVLRTGVLAGKTIAVTGAGTLHSMALCADGTLAAWGRNGNGELGTGDLTDSAVPVMVSRATLADGERFVTAATWQGASHNLGLIAIPVIPRIAVEQPTGTGLASGRSTVDFGVAAAGTAVARTFTVRNNGIVPLVIGGVEIDGPAAAEFEIITPPSATVAVGGSTTFVVSFTAGSPFTRSAMLHLATNDPYAAAFEVNLTASVPGALAAAFNAGTDISLVANSFTAIGSTVTLALNFAPVTGMPLTVVKNTGPGSIGGTFDNLAQGQVVTLEFGGAIYRFVANYYGGSGNDLVLQWAGTRALAWGFNYYGQLGNAGTTNGSSPAAVTTTGALAGKTIIATAAGANHSLALTTDGKVAGWGYNTSGQLGNGTPTDSNVPVLVNTAGVLAGKSVVALAAGESHNLVLCEDGTLAAWGYNGYGQLGNNTTATATAPLAVDRTGALAGKSVIAVAAGDDFSLALCSDGTLTAWGNGYDGEFGNGSTGISSVPVAVIRTGVLAGRTVVSLAAGGRHVLALCSDGTLAAWGYNDYGQLGNGNTIQSNVPAAVDQTGVLAGKTIVAVAAGGSHSLALCSDGTVAAWGSNSSGRLGNGTTAQSNVPVLVSTEGALAGKSVVAVAAGSSHSLAQCSDGTLAAWGYNFYGQLGNGTTTNSTTPVAVSSSTLAAGEKFVAVASGQSSGHSLGLVAVPFVPRIVLQQPSGAGLASGIGTVDMGSGAVGIGVTRSFTIANTGNVPLLIGGVTIDGPEAADFQVTAPPAASVEPGATTTFTVTFTAGAQFSRNAALHVASNDPATGVFHVNLTATGSGALDFTYATGAEVPLTSSGFTATGSTVNFTLNHAPATGASLMVVKNTGLGFINGTFSNLAQGQPVTLGYGGVIYDFVANYYGGSGNDLVLQWAATRPLAWGYNNYGQLGNGGTANSYFPASVDTAGVLAGKSVTAMAAGTAHGLALCADGTLAGWGYNNYGQLGNNSTINSKLPVAVNRTGVLAGRTIIAVAAGDDHNLALCADGTLAAWGYNSSGQLGIGSTTQSNVPVAVNQTGVLAGKSIVAVAGGGSHSLALCSDGTLVAWGANSNGQLGIGSNTLSSVPVAVTTTGALAGKIVVAVAAGYYHSLAVCADGTLATWGSNSYGPLGNGSTTDSNVPVAVDQTSALTGKTVTAVAAAYNHSLALCADGTLAAWGYNGSGQLGNGNTTQSNVPVAVEQMGVLAGKTTVAVAAGGDHSLTLCADGTAAAWGSGSYGRLGNGSGSTSNVPVAVSRAMLAAGEQFIIGTSGVDSDFTLALVAMPPPGRIAVEQPAGTALVSGGGTVDFGTVDFKGAATSRTFTVRNPGGGPLTISGATFGGDHGADFSLNTLPAPVPAGASTTFVVSFAPGAPGVRSAVMHLISNDPLGSPFDVNLTGIGGSSSTLAATYTSGLEVPLSSGSFTATGNTVSFSLNHAPAPGTQLTVVENTGLGWIRGRFDDLAHGQLVPLTFAGTTYNFVANYYGGSGNDLVLQWATTRPCSWGGNTYGQLGNNTTAIAQVPFEVATSGILAGKTIVAVAAGGDHSLALCADGTLAAWGYNNYGQLGTGNTSQRTVPVAVTRTGVLAGKTVVAVAAGKSHSLALCADGTLAAWGYNGNGRLGNGGSTDSYVPVAVVLTGALAARTVVAIEAGNGHSLALCADGTLVAWGYNNYGQLGTGNTTDSNVPVAVSKVADLAGRTVVAVTTGYSHSMALCADGTLFAWGYNYNGQLGNGTTTDSLMPVPVDRTDTLAGRAVVAVAAGYYHSLALCADGTLAAWGYNSSGQLGNGSSTQRNVPTAVDQTGLLAGKAVVAVTAGYYHSLARCADGTLAAWGSNSNGQLGTDSPTSSPVPVAVSMARVAPAARIVAGASDPGAFHNLAIIADPVAARLAIEHPAGTDLVNGGSTVNFGPGVPGGGVSRTFTIRNVGTLDLTDLAVSFDGASGGDFTLSAPPAATVAPGGSTTFTVTFMPGGIDVRSAVMHVASNDPLPGGFAVNLTGSSVGVLEATYDTGLEVPLSPSGFTATGNTVNLTLNHAPAAGATLMVVRNTGLDFIQGRFGNLTHGQPVPLTFAGVTYDFVANYYGGSGNDLVLQWAATRLLAWGSNGSGRLGNDSFAQSNAPTEVATEGILAGRTVVATAAGAGHSLALCADGTLAAWGDNLYGQLGNGSTTSSKTPVPVTQTGVLAGKTVVAIAAGRYHNLALCTDGTIAAWGRGLEGQLGVNSPTNSPLPVEVGKPTGSPLLGKKVVAVAAGGYHSLARCADGTLAAWGYNQAGQLGDNTFYTRNLPVAVNSVSGLSALFGKKIAAVSAGEAHTVALCSDGSLAAWGDNSDGQLGTPFSSPASVPQAIGTTGTVLAGRSVVAVAAGANHNLALCADGGVVAWGDGSYGQLGDNSTSSFRSGVVAVNTTAGLSALAGRTVVAIAGGYRHSMAMCADGTLTAWGYNYFGQVGDNTTSNRKVPVAVSTATLPAGGNWVAGASGQSAHHSLAIAGDRLAPEIVVEDPAMIGLVDDTSVVDFGAVPSGGRISRTFTIRNPGNATLDSLLIAADGPHAAEFEVGPPGATTLAPGASTTFTVIFAPTGLAVRSAALHIISNVTGAANPFDIAVTGTGLTQLEQWRLTNFQTTANSGDAADLATPRHDGIVNLLKFATGMDPTRPGTLPGSLAKSGGNLVFTYSRSKAAVSDGISFAVEWSDTLEAGGWSTTGVVETGSSQGDTDLVTATLPAGSGPGRFVRLRVAHP